MKNTRNKLIATVVLMLFLALPAHAQVFIMDDEFESNMRVGESEFVVPSPYQGGDLDQFVPLGDGLLLLAGLGGAYQLKKRKKEQA